MEADAGAATTLHRDVGDFGDLPTPFGDRQDGLAVLARRGKAAITSSPSAASFTAATPLPAAPCGFTAAGSIRSTFPRRVTNARCDPVRVPQTEAAR